MRKSSPTSLISLTRHITVIGVCLCDTRTQKKTGRSAAPKCYCWFGRQWPEPWRCPPTRSLSVRPRCAGRDCLARSWADANWFAGTTRIINGECLAAETCWSRVDRSRKKLAEETLERPILCARPGEWVRLLKKKQAFRTHARRTQACEAK